MEFRIGSDIYEIKRLKPADLIAVDHIPYTVFKVETIKTAYDQMMAEVKESEPDQPVEIEAFIPILRAGLISVNGADPDIDLLITEKQPDDIKIIVGMIITESHDVFSVGTEIHETAIVQIDQMARRYGKTPMEIVRDEMDAYLFNLTIFHHAAKKENERAEIAAARNRRSSC